MFVLKQTITLSYMTTMDSEQEPTLVQLGANLKALQKAVRF